jgi:hypothetical protein
MAAMPVELKTNKKTSMGKTEKRYPNRQDLQKFSSSKCCKKEGVFIKNTETQFEELY